MQWTLEEIASPIGTLTAVAEDGALIALEMEGNDERWRRFLARRAGAGVVPSLAPTPPSASIRPHLDAYFAGDLAALARVRITLTGTAFERRVREELLRIPPGATVSYTELARRSGHPGAVRAAGSANAHNPLAIVVPCHRVIGADGSLTGYAGGLERKRWLLTHEGALAEGALGLNASASEAGSRRDRSRPREDRPAGAPGSAP